MPAKNTIAESLMALREVFLCFFIGFQTLAILFLLLSCIARRY